MIRESQEVLVAEDDDEDYELFAEAVSEVSRDISLERVRNGDALMEALHGRLPHVLFLDVLMPCKDGKDCIQEIRSHKKFDELPIVVYSSIGSPESIEFFFRHGTNMYVLKPRTYTDLVQVLHKVFAVNWKAMRYYPTLSDFVLNPNTRRT